MAHSSQEQKSNCSLFLLALLAVDISGQVIDLLIHHDPDFDKLRVGDGLVLDLNFDEVMVDMEEWALVPYLDFFLRHDVFNFQRVSDNLFLVSTLLKM